MVKPVLSTLAALFALLAMPASAHEPYAWIMENPQTFHCCGPQDCRPLKYGELTTKNGAWFINGAPVPEGNVYPSRDPRGRSFGCFFDPPALTRPRCAFPGGVG